MSALQDMHADETEVEMTYEEKMARFEHLKKKLETRGLGQWGDEHETDEYFKLKKELNQH